jgi:putative methyltransferase (TIGR04325 family)
VIRLLQRLRNAIFNWGFFGNYKTFAEALSDSTGYRTEEITRRAAGRLEAQKRDALTNHLDPRSQQILAALAVVLSHNPGQTLRVIDFGGGTGHYYYLMRRYLDHLSWAVLETPEMAAACGAFANAQLSFHSSTDTLTGEYDIVIMSSVLNFVEEPLATFRKLSERALFCLINRLPLIPSERDRLTIQRVPPSIYRASYPFWFFSENLFLRAIEDTHKVLMRWDVPQDKYFLDGRVVVSCGLLLERR